MPERAEPVFLERLGTLARERGDEEAVIFVDGPSFTWAALQERVRAHAAGLQALGVVPGERVLSWLPNGPLAVLNLLALATLGAVCVPINTAYRGALLEHVLANSGARRMIAHGALVERLAGLPLHGLREIVVLGPERPALPVVLHEASILAGDAAGFAPPLPPAPWDTLTVIYTSGTTGPSKGVLMSYRHAECAARGFRNIGPGDRVLNCLPMYHVGGVVSLLWAILHDGASIVIAEGFRTGEFWALVARHRVTTTGLLGAMVDFLNAQPPREGEREHGLRSVVIAPYGPAAIAFGERFGVPVYTEFNMSELSVPLFAGPDPRVPGTCGVPQPGAELRLVDEHDEPVPEGAVGELVVRMARPWSISHGYLGDDAATARAWRNGWFHTGDLFRREPSGHWFFVDRRADAIRRRGENISAFEVENAVRAHPAVIEAAVVGVPAPGGSEQEVLAVLRVDRPEAFSREELIGFLRTRLPHFAVPRYLRLVDDLPRTPTQKIEKHRLREIDLTDDTWDREAAGLHLARETLERRE